MCGRKEIGDTVNDVTDIASGEIPGSSVCIVYSRLQIGIFIGPTNLAWTSYRRPCLRIISFQIETSDVYGFDMVQVIETGRDIG